jgi:hypothetical protein
MGVVTPLRARKLFGGGGDGDLVAQLAEVNRERAQLEAARCAEDVDDEVSGWVASARGSAGSRVGEEMLAAGSRTTAFEAAVEVAVAFVLSEPQFRLWLRDRVGGPTLTRGQRDDRVAALKTKADQLERELKRRQLEAAKEAAEAELRELEGDGA